MKRMIRTVIVLLAGLLGGGATASGQVYLNSGSAGTDWRLRPQAEVSEGVADLSSTGYDASGWVKAIVPGTAFSAYVAAGLE